LLLPALNRARSAADSAGCRSNLHQLTLGLALYTQTGGAYPYGWLYPTQVAFVVGVAPWWPTNNYVEQNGAMVYLGPRQGIFACPGYNRIRGQFVGGPPYPPYPDTPLGGAYGYNWAGSPTFRNGVGFLGLGGLTNLDPTPLAPGLAVVGQTPENAVVSPSDMIAIADAFLAPSFQGFPVPTGLPYLPLMPSTNGTRPFSVCRRATRSFRRSHGGTEGGGTRGSATVTSRACGARTCLTGRGRTSPGGGTATTSRTIGAGRSPLRRRSAAAPRIAKPMSSRNRML
jgi:hypothetical protein